MSNRYFLLFSFRKMLRMAVAFCDDSCQLAADKTEGTYFA
jgi:hypothetical protein